MNDNRDEADRLLFSCERCGCWPMAYQGVRPYGGETSFSCPRCKATSTFKVKSGDHRRSHLEALAG